MSAPPHRRRPNPAYTPEIQQRRRQVRGLILIAALILIGSLWRAGFAHTFTPGWWRLW